MTRSRRVLAWGLVSFLIPICAAWAQDSLPRIGYAYPAGGRQGATFQITLGGQFLNDIGRVSFSGTGVEARKVEGIQPMTEMDVRALRDRLAQLAKDQKELATRREMAEISRKLARYMAAQQRRQTQPAISETIELEVTIRADAESGLREMRLETARGVSNPLRFCVGRLPEFREQEPDLVVDEQGYNLPIRFPATATTDITLPAVVNGQIIPREPDALRFGAGFTPGDADRYRFEAKKGQTLVIAASARELIPYLADAVPGWFQTTLTLYDAQGRELAFGDDYRFHPDPVLVFKVPADGPYVVEIKDAISRGRPDFVYRITLGELPFITSIFPLGGRAGGQTTVELQGRNLPVDKLTPDAKDTPVVYPLTVRQGDLLSNTVPFAVDTLPECRDKEPNDDAGATQRVT
ncbi:MAG: PPC domain-containing protein, partial [Pirellulaceae bacterium]|nr:PPC domain-containing protein [Pirellulaceae bacterium]